EMRGFAFLFYLLGLQRFDLSGFIPPDRLRQTGDVIPRSQIANRVFIKIGIAELLATTKSAGLDFAEKVKFLGREFRLAFNIECFEKLQRLPGDHAARTRRRHEINAITLVIRDER